MEQLRTLLLWCKRIWINYTEAGGISSPGPDGDLRSEGSSATPCAVPIPYNRMPKAPRTALETSSGASKKQLAASAGMKQVVEPVRKETKAPGSCIPDAAPRGQALLGKTTIPAKHTAASPARAGSQHGSYLPRGLLRCSARPTRLSQHVAPASPRRRPRRAPQHTKEMGRGRTEGSETAKGAVASGSDFAKGSLSAARIQELIEPGWQDAGTSPI